MSVFIFYFLAGRWRVGDPESNRAGLRCVQTGLPTIPVTGWQYYSGSWTDDSNLTVTGNILFIYYDLYIHLHFYK